MAVPHHAELTSADEAVRKHEERRLVWTVLGVWVASRIGVALVSLVGAYSSLDRQRSTVPNFLAIWNRWDAQLFMKIARWGYFDRGVHYPDCCTEAFFPGQSLVLRAVHLFLPSWIGAGLAVSFVAGGFASVALAKLVHFETGSYRAARNSVVFLVLSPFALFLFAGYSEALFLALATSGWLAARQRNWVPAGLLLGYAAAVRITGLFLAVAFVVEYVSSRRRDGKPILSVAGLPLFIPFAAISSYFLYLHAKTGDWNAWQHAQKIGWYRELTPPLKALRTTWHYAFSGNINTDLTLSFFGDTLMVFIGLALAVVLLLKRRWAHAIYISLGVAALATSTYYFSVSRSALLWFPLWILLAEWSLRRRWLLPAWAMICGPMMAAYVVSFTNGRWVN